MNIDRTPFIAKFTQEARELVQKLNDSLIQLEKEPENHDCIRELMRVAHTMKGSAKILRFQAISQLAHKMEDLLSNIYERQLPVRDDEIDVLFTGTDMMSRCVEEIAQGSDERVDIKEVMDTLERTIQDDDTFKPYRNLRPSSEYPVQATTAPELPEVNEGVEQAASSPIAYPLLEETSAENSLSAVPLSKKTTSPAEETIRISVANLDNAVRLVSEIAVSHRKSEHELSVLKDLHRLATKHAKHLQHVLHSEGVHISEKRKTELLQGSQALMKHADIICKERRDETALMDLVMNELHEDVLGMRMLPLSTVFQTFPRAVRDLAKHFGKEIDFHMEGAETTLDKKIIEKLGAPLIHVLRNCIDHGIETPQERLAQGKSATGHITIAARQHSGHIEVVITDDGCGIHTEKLCRRLIKRGIFPKEHVQQMDEAEIINTVFLPSVSTSEIITDISGRGFGMDIVKTEIEQLKGSVALTSQPGKGTQCFLTIPATLTTLRCLIFSSQGQQFAVPIDTIAETLHISRSECIQVVGYDAIRLRNEMVYIVALADILQLPRTAFHDPEKMFVLVAHSSGKRIGFIVDEILDEQDVVVKQLPTHMRRLKTIAGVTISGENRIILILHIPEIIKHIKHTIAEHDVSKPEKAARSQPKILVVEDSVSTGEIEKLILESQGYHVELVQDGSDALEYMRHSQYDLIVTDVEMPGMDGFSLTEHVRDLPNYAQIPIVIVTSLERESDKRRGIQVGADAYITKGDFEQTHLVETVKSLLRVAT